MLPDPRETPVVTVPEAGRWFGLGRSASYAAAERGELPTIAIGRRLVVPVAKTLALLGIPTEPLHASADGGAEGVPARDHTDEPQPLRAIR